MGEGCTPVIPAIRRSQEFKVSYGLPLPTSAPGDSTPKNKPKSRYPRTRLRKKKKSLSKHNPFHLSGEFRLGVDQLHSRDILVPGRGPALPPGAEPRVTGRACAEHAQCGAEPWRTAAVLCMPVRSCSSACTLIYKCARPTGTPRRSGWR